MRTTSTTLAALVALVLVSCGLDGGIKPLESAIEGKITFVGEWPDSLVELRVVTYEDYPPAEFTDLSTWSDPLTLGQSEISYTMPVPPGQYALVAVAGRYEDAGWTALAQFSTSGTFPDTVRLADRVSVAGGVDFVVSFSSSRSGITGRLIFANAWPDTVSSIRVGALANSMTNPPYPTIVLSDINNLSDVFTRDDTSYVYSIPLAPGVYRTIAAAWMDYDATGQPADWGLLNAQKLLHRPILGVYSASDPGSLAADSVVVEQDRWITGVDITLDFSRVSL